MIPLVSAERAWSQAMELKAQLEKEAISYKRQHMVSLLPPSSRPDVQGVACLDSCRIWRGPCNACSRLSLNHYHTLLHI